MPTYTGISSEAFRHPLDRQAEQALRSVPGFDLLARKFVEFVSERPQFVYQMGNSIQVGPRQYGSVYQLFRECVRDLDMFPEPTLFISQDPYVNAYALGEESPLIVLNSGMLDLLNEAELRTVIAHELGHIKCTHTTLTQMGIWATFAINIIGQATFGLGSLLSGGLQLAFYEWRRKAELSADRAALLLMDDLNPVMYSMMKLSGGSVQHINETSLEEFIRQSDRYQELNQDGLNQMYRFFLYNIRAQPLSHPFTVERLHHIREWEKSEEYGQIRRGNYQRANATGSVNVSSESSPPPRSGEADDLRRQIEDMQREIDRIRREDDRERMD